MYKRAYKNTSLMLVLVMLFTMLAPIYQPFMPAGAYAAETEAVLLDNDLLSDEIIKTLTPDIPTNISASEKLTSHLLASNMLPSDMLALNMTQMSTVDANSATEGEELSVCVVEFEHPEYYAVRSNDYVYIPVVLFVDDVDGVEAVEVSYDTSDGTAVAGVDYQPASGTLQIGTVDGTRFYDFIKIKLIDSGVDGDKTIQLSLSKPYAVPERHAEAVLGDQSKAVVTIGSNYNYTAPASWEDLYNGWNFNDTGIEKWDGIKPSDSWGAEEYEYFGRFKTIGFGNSFNVGIQAKNTYRMSKLEFQWKCKGGSKAVVSSQPGTVTSKYDTLPPYESFVGQAGAGTEYMYDFKTDSISVENSSSLLYVVFYAGSSAVVELLTAKIQKKQYDFHVSIPGGSTLEVAGQKYQRSFSGKFTYDGPEELKAIAPAGLSFTGWDYYLPSGGTVHLAADAEISINDLVTAMGSNFNLYEAQNLGIQLRPVFKRDTYQVQVSSTAGGSATGGGTYLYDSEVTLTATPEDGFAFSHWSIAGQAPVYDNPWIFSAEKHLTVTANFVKGYDIIAEAYPPEGGTAVIEGTAMENATVTARATANPGYRFVSWTENDPGGTVVSNNVDYAFNATADLHLVANFEPVQSRITVKAYPTSGGKVSGNGVYHYGDAVTLTAEPYSDYYFVNWTENGQEISTDTEYTFVLNTDGERIFTANFNLKPGSFSMTPCRQFAGEPVTFDASMIFQDDEGITFDWQFGDGSTTSGKEVSHTYTGAGTYEVTVVARQGSRELVNKTRSITIVEPLPLEQSDFRVEPGGVSLVEPGGKTSWTVVFTNNGVPMANKVINVNDELLGGTVNIVTDAAGVATYETSVPASQSQYELYVVNFSHDTLAAARGVQVYSTSITLTGQVFDSYSGRRLEGAKVTAGGKTTLTDSEGLYTITDLPPGNCALSVAMNGYQVANQVINLVSSESVYNIPLLRYIPGTLPVIGLVYSERSDSVRAVDRFFPYGESLPLKFNVTIDWRGHGPGSVNFILPDRTLAGTLDSGCYTASRVIDVGTEISPGGRLYVQVVTETGVESAPVDAMIETTPPPPFDPGTQVIEVPSIERMTIAQDMSFVGGSLISTNLPGVKVEVEIDDNGTASMYFGVVCAKKDAKPEDLMSSLVGPDQFEEVKKLYRQIQKQKSMVSTGVDFEVIVGGKYVFVYDQDNKEWDFTEGWLVINGSGEVTTTAYAMTPILVPVYIQASVGGGLTVHMGMTPEELEMWQVTMTPEMWARVAAGIGLAGLISAEVFGKVHGQFTVIVSRGEFDNWIVGATCGVKFVVFIFSYEKSVTQSWSNEQVAQLAMSLPETGELKFLSRDYRERPSTWMPPEQPRVMATGDDPTGGRDLGETVIQTNAFPYSEPALIMAEDGPMIVWVADNPERSDENRTEVQYSTFDGGTWSVARAVYNDGTADFYPQAAPAAGWKGSLRDNIAAAAWINLSKELVGNAGLNDLLSDSQIAVSFYDRSADSWTETQGFPADGFQDTSPRVATLDKSALVVWNRSALFDDGQRSVAGSVYVDVYGDGTAGLSRDQNENIFAALYPQQTDIVFSLWNGRTWSEPQVVVEGAGSVIKSSLTGHGNDALFAYTADLDGNLGTAGDQELYYTTFERGGWSPPVRVSDNDVQDINPQAVYLEGEPLLFWYRGGKVLYLKGLDSEPSVAAECYGEGLANFTLATGGGESLALVWGDAAGDGQEIFTVVYDPAYDSWSRPIQLTNTGAVNRSIDAALDGEGNILAVYNRTAAEIVGDTHVTGQTDLVFTTLTVGHDLAVEDISLAVENPVPGSEVTVSAVVANRGELAQQDVEVAFYEGNPLRGGKQIDTTLVMEGIMAAGERRDISVQWTVPQKLAACDIYVVVDPANKVADRSPDNNTGFISTLNTDLKIVGVQTQPVGFDRYLITATVSNRGLITAEDAAVSLYRTTSGQYGPVRGELVETRTLGKLQPGQQKDDTFTWSFVDGDFENGYTFLYLEAASAQENVPGGKNTARVLVRKPVIGGGPVQGFTLDKDAITLPVGGVQQLQGIFDPPDASIRAIAWKFDNEAVARVDAFGRVTAVAVGTAVITATTLDGGFTDTCAVTVTEGRKTLSTYKISLDLAGRTFIAGSGSGTVLPVILEADAVGDMGYGHVRCRVYVSGPGAAQLLTEDPAGLLYDVVSTGYWGPAEGLALANDHWSTTEFTAMFSEPGNYTITFSLVDLDNHEAVIARGTAEVSAAVEYIEASLGLMPRTLNTKNPGQWVSARLSTPEGYDHRQVDVNSIRLQYGGKSIVSRKVEVTGSGLLIKFEGSEVAGLVRDPGVFALDLTCRAGSQFFRAVDSINFIVSPEKK